MITNSELPEPSPEFAEHIADMADAYKTIPTLPVRWSVFALNGLFNQYLKHVDQTTGLGSELIVVTSEQEIIIPEIPKLTIAETEQAVGRVTIGCSAYAEPYSNFGNLLVNLRNDRNIPFI